MNSTLAHARSFLFVPASRPERFVKALESAADCVILDLEDAVAPEQKGAARDHLSDQLHGFTPTQLARTLVRINAAGSSWYDDDVRLLAGWTARGLAGAMVPKAESAGVLQATVATLGAAAQLVPLIESLAGLDAVKSLVQVRQVARVAFGHLDFQLDLGMRCQPDEAELTSVRFSLVAASRRAQLAPPVDGVTVETSQSERLLRDARRAHALGFGGKLCIHPSQVDAINQTFSPSPDELAWARRVLSEAQARRGEAFSLDGRMVDLPVLRLAERTLQLARIFEGAAPPDSASSSP